MYYPEKTAVVALAKWGETVPCSTEPHLCGGHIECGRVRYLMAVCLQTDDLHGSRIESASHDALKIVAHRRMGL